ncbi:MAG: molybdopterin biosynthesis protein [Dehalococcoidia bacterium]
MRSPKKSKRNYYLEDIPLNSAITEFDEALKNYPSIVTKTEIIKIANAINRVTAKPVFAKLSSPHYDSAAMDGVAVSSCNTNGATDTKPKFLQNNIDFAWVNTGDEVPKHFDSVIMIENIKEVENGIEIRAPVPPYHDVRPIGEDIVESQMILPAGHKLRVYDLGACAGCGINEIEVMKFPKIAIIPTGTELIAPTDRAKAGQILEYNSLMLSAQISDWGGIGVTLPVVPDNPEQLQSSIKKATTNYDLVIVNAGSSAGAKDYTMQAIDSLGTVIVHGVAIKPGHPVILGIVNKKPVIGLPGYPVSTIMTSELFVKPIIEKALRVPSLSSHKVKATLTRKLVSQFGSDEFVRLRLARIRGELAATAIQRGAGVIMSLVEADGITKIPKLSEGIDAGTEIEVKLIKHIDEINNTLVMVGSHDLTIDILSNLLKQQTLKSKIASSNIGSIAGLIALSKGEAHIAGCHLLEPDTGDYNLDYVKKYLPKMPVSIITLVHREQGLMTGPKNPLNINSITDLTKESVRYVNRQRGSGTRLLLDYELSKNRIESEKINGYRKEEYTHLAVASAVKSGAANVGLGIKSAAITMGLNFIPVMKERFDLIIPNDQIDSQPIKTMLEIIKSKQFKTEVSLLGGYDTKSSGKLVCELSENITKND